MPSGSSRFATRADGADVRACVHRQKRCGALNIRLASSSVAASSSCSGAVHPCRRRRGRTGCINIPSEPPPLAPLRRHEQRDDTKRLLQSRPSRSWSGDPGAAGPPIRTAWDDRCRPNCPAPPVRSAARSAGLLTLGRCWLYRGA